MWAIFIFANKQRNIEQSNLTACSYNLTCEDVRSNANEETKFPSLLMSATKLIISIAVIFPPVFSLTKMTGAVGRIGPYVYRQAEVKRSIEAVYIHMIR